MIELRWLIKGDEHKSDPALMTLQFRYYKFRGGPWQDVPEVFLRQIEQKKAPEGA